MANQDFTTYTETDPNGRITVSSSRITWAGLTRNEDAYVYDDKGVNHFDGDFEHLLTFFQDTGWDNNAVVVTWAIANDIDDYKGLIDNLKDSLTLYNQPSVVVNRLNLVELDGGTTYTDQFSVSRTATWLLYLKIKRDESVGSFGQIQCFIYSDSGRTNLLDTLSLTLHTSKKDFRYIYGVQSFNTASALAGNGYTENLDLQEPVNVTIVPSLLSSGYNVLPPTITTGRRNPTVPVNVRDDSIPSRVKVDNTPTMARVNHIPKRGRK